MHAGGVCQQVIRMVSQMYGRQGLLCLLMDTIWFPWGCIDYLYGLGELCTGAVNPVIYVSKTLCQGKIPFL